MTTLFAFLAWMFGHATHPVMPDHTQDTCVQLRSGPSMSCEVDKTETSVSLLISNGF